MKFTSIFKFRQRDGRGVEKGEDTRPTLKNFFKQFWRKFSQLLSLNIIILLQVAPIVGALVAFLTMPMTPSYTSALTGPLHGAGLLSPSFAADLVLSFEGLPLNIPAHSPATYWIIGGCVLFCVLTMGWLSAGSFYVLRGLVRGDAVFVFGDFWYGIKRNFKQGFLYGIIDSVLILLFVYNIVTYWQSVGSLGNDILFWLQTALALLYIIMRPYMYLMLVTFDMKIRKMFKNALIFTTLGIKRNLMALLGTVLLLGLHLLLIILFMPTVVITVILPFVYIFAAIGFIWTYATYPIIDRYMVQPCLAEQNDDEDEAEA